MKIYLPDTSYACYVVQNEGVIRAYEETPRQNSTIDYRDFYIKSDYIFRDSYQTFSSYSTLPTCLDSNVITNDVYYRLDFPQILLSLFILLILCFYFPYKIISRILGKWGKI